MTTQKTNIFDGYALNVENIRDLGMVETFGSGTNFFIGGWMRKAGLGRELGLTQAMCS